MPKPAADSGEKHFIKFTDSPGLVAERTVSKKDLESVGLVVENDLVWNRSNRFMIDATNAPEEVLEFFRNEPGFTVSTSPAAPRTFDSPTLGENAPVVSAGEGNEGSVGTVAAPSSGGSTAGASGT